MATFSLLTSAWKSTTTTVGFDPLEDAVDLVERQARDLQADRAAEVDHADPHPARLDDDVALAGVGVWVVGGPDHPLGAVEEVVGLAVAVDVVAGGDHVAAGVEEGVGGLLGDPHPPGGVLAVDDRQVGPVPLAQLRHRRLQAAPAGPADHVADEEDFHVGPYPRACLDRGEAAQGEAGERAVGDDQDRQVQQRAADARTGGVERRRSSPAAPA